jgi:hypothetical protein
MSSVLFSRGINTQTGGRRKADEVTRDIVGIKEQVAIAASMSSSNREGLAKCNALMSELESKISSLVETLGGLQAKVKELEERKERGKSKASTES